ncbi:Cyclin-dependent kinase inhibitor 3 [Spatholobus suberectus]|nr:Cyclin-dependent kinase inhibitor 3 [Spatholobus suberectus]
MSAQVGVRTRARAALAAMEAATSAEPSHKRKNVSNSEEESKSSKTPRTSSAAAKPATEAENVPPVPETKKRCLSPTSSDFPASCCSSNGSTGLHDEEIKLLDLEVESAQVETSTCNGGEEIERRKMDHSGELRENSQELVSMAINSRRPSSTAQTMPTELELEEFFATAEKDIQKQFQDKYNYDVVKDVPLEGRYDWVQLKP